MGNKIQFYTILSIQFDMGVSVSLVFGSTILKVQLWH